MPPAPAIDHLTTAALADLARRVLTALGQRGDEVARAALVESFSSAADGLRASWSAGRVGAAPLEHRLTLYGVTERQPGPRWRAVFDAAWPGYRHWYLSEGVVARPTRAEAERMLRRHMPELCGTWERLVDLTGGDEVAARMLTLWNPPAFQPACTQAVAQTEEGPILIRNYDYDPQLLERVVSSTALLGRVVIGTSDCLWGLLDGMNESGLVVSLAFGGRLGVGSGFGIPLVVRYLLEVCDTVADVRRVLTRTPVNAAYNLTALDAAGRHVTAFIAPGCPPEFSASPVATNHRPRQVEWPQYAAAVHSVERYEAAEAIVAARVDSETVVAHFLGAPLRSTHYGAGFGTLYTAVYRPHSPGVEYVWPDARWIRSADAPDSVHQVTLVEQAKQAA